MNQFVKSLLKKIPGFYYLNSFRIKFINILIFFIPDKIFLKRRYRQTFKRKLNLKNPKKFNEKVLWRILKDRKKIYSDLSDKYLVRDYVKEKIGGQYLTKLYGVYHSVEEIDYDQFPEKFVLKCNHDCGSAVFCWNKDQFDRESANKNLSMSLKRNYYNLTREYQYKKIKPLILCEEYLGFNSDLPMEYKFHVFRNNGKRTTIIQCVWDRSTEIKKAMLDENWNILPFHFGFKIPDKLKKPKNLSKMLELGHKLAEPFAYVRVDLYEFNGQIYFGEMTFTPAAGNKQFSPSEWDDRLGQLWKQYTEMTSRFGF